MAKDCSFLILTTSYSRSLLLSNICRQLQEEAKYYNYLIWHVILDDGTENGAELYTNHIMKKHDSENYKIRLLRNPYNFGKKQYWKTYSDLLLQVKLFRYEFAYCISDDVYLCKDFITRTSTMFRDIINKDKMVVAKNLLVVEKTRWNTNRYIDGFYICTPLFFELLNYNIQPISEQRWINNPELSSGVFTQITERFKQLPYKIDESGDYSYAQVLDVNSKMHPNIQRSKMINFIDNHVEYERE